MSSDTESDVEGQVVESDSDASKSTENGDPDDWKEEEEEEEEGDLSTLGAAATCVKSFTAAKESSQIVRRDNGGLQTVVPLQQSTGDVQSHSGLDAGLTSLEHTAGQNVIQYNVSQHIHVQQFGDVTVEGARNLNIGGTQNITRETEPQRAETRDEKPLTKAQKIRVRTESRIHSWTKGMVKTQGLAKVLTLLKDGATCVTVKGSPGVGKTTAAYMALEELHTEGRQVFQVLSPREFTEITSTYSRPVIMLDDIFGDLEFDEAEWKRWKPVLKEVLAVKEHRSHETVTKTREASLLILGRSYIFKTASRHMGRLSDLVRKEQYVVDMSSPGLQSIHEKLEIWNAIVTGSGISLNENRILQVCQLRGQHGFPHVCRLFATMHKETKYISPEKFFNNPLEFLGKTIETFMENEVKLSLFEEIIKGGGKISVRELGHVGWNRKILQAAEDLVGTYLRKEEDYFKFDHPSIYDCVAYHLCKLYPLFVIEKCDMSFIHQRLCLQSSGSKRRCLNHVIAVGYSFDIPPVTESDLVIHIPRSYITDMAKRFAAEITGSNLQVLSHSACADESFVQELMLHIPLSLSDLLALRDMKSNDTFLSLITSSKSSHLLRNIHTKTERNFSITETQIVLFGICRYAAIDALSYLIEISDCIDVNDQSGDNGKTPLMVAAETGDSGFVQTILSLKPDLKLKDREDKCLFHYLCENGHTLAVKQILPQTDNINLEDKWGWTPLHYACRSAQFAVVELLVKKAAVVDAKALELACMAGNLDTVKLLFKKGTPVDMVCKTGHIPIVAACLSGRTDVVGFLMDNGASVNSEEMGSSVLHIVCEWNKPHTAEYLLQHGAEIDKMDSNGCTPLHKAVQVNSTNCVQVLLKAGVNVNIETNTGETALHKASENAFTRCISVLLQAESNVNVQCRNGSSPLHKAAWSGSVECVKMLLKAGSDVNIQDKDGYTALHTAAGRGYVDCVTLLIKAGSDVNACSKDDHTALYVASENKATECINILLQAAADVNVKCKQGMSPLRVASEDKTLIAAYQRRSIECARLLLNAGADVNTQDNYGCTPLFKAVQYGCRDVLDFLHDAGADVNIANNRGFTPLYAAVKWGHHEILCDLLKFKAAVNQKGLKEYIPLHKAIKNHSREYFLSLLEAGADVNVQDHLGYTAIHTAVQTRQYDCVDLLLTAGADVNIASDDGYTALQGAAEHGAAACLSTLLTTGADVNAEDGDGKTALHKAAWNGSVEGVDMLLKAGARVNSKTKNGRTALHCAVYKSSVKCIASLLKAGANVNALDDGDNTPLHEVSFFTTEADDKCVDMLLRKGANVSIPNEKGQTPIHIAARARSYHCVQMLMKAGADVNRKCKLGETALTLAAGINMPQCIDSLLKAGADANSFDENGCTALHKAASRGSMECVDLLLKSGAKVRGPDKYGNTELHYASRSGSEECVQRFLDHDIGVNVQNKNGNTALHCASPSSKCVEKLLNAGANVNVRSRKGYTALHKAVFRNASKSVDMLIKCGADVMIADALGETPLHKAVLGRAMFHMFDTEDLVKVCELLITSNSDCVNAQDNDGNTPLHLLCPSDHLNWKEARSRRLGFKPSYSPYAHMPLLELLLHHGAHVKIHNKEGVAALCEKCQKRRDEWSQRMMFE